MICRFKTPNPTLILKKIVQKTQSIQINTPIAPLLLHTTVIFECEDLMIYLSYLKMTAAINKYNDYDLDFQYALHCIILHCISKIYSTIMSEQSYKELFKKHPSENNGTGCKRKALKLIEKFVLLSIMVNGSVGL